MLTLQLARVNISEPTWPMRFKTAPASDFVRLVLLLGPENVGPLARDSDGIDRLDQHHKIRTKGCATRDNSAIALLLSCACVRAEGDLSQSVHTSRSISAGHDNGSRVNLLKACILT